MTDQTQPHGIIDHSGLERKTDYLYRVSIKCLIKNDNEEVLVVKESGKTWWDLPGGGIDHGEDVKTAIARELKEEVEMTGDFTYSVIDVDNPAYLEIANVYQMRLIFAVSPEVMKFNKGIDADDIRFIDPELLKDSDNPVEKRIYQYANK